MSTTKVRSVSFGGSLFVFGFVILSLITTITLFGGSPQIPLLVSTVFAAGFGLKAGFSYNEMEIAMLDTIRKATQAVLIILVIGAIIGTWIAGGIVPTLIYYGLKILSPGFFLVASCLICAVVALATGSSWSTAGTIGVALVGVGIGLGIPPAMTAGAIISGAYFGDKMSPLSDTTNLAPAMAGSELFEHIKHMLFTTAPSLIVALIGYTILGLKFAGNDADTHSVVNLINVLEGQFYLSPVLLIPPCLVILMVKKKIPAVPALVGSAFLGVLCAVVFQGQDLAGIIKAAHYGFSADTGLETADKLLNRGGIQSMMWTVSLILIALSFSGVVEKTGMIQVVAQKILSMAKSRGSLIASTIGVTIFTNYATGVQYVALVLPGTLFKNVYPKRGLHPKNLSRALEDSGTLVAPLVPWGTDGAFLAAALGVTPWAYIPYAFMNLVNPIVSIFLGYTGWTIETVDPEDYQDEKKIHANSITTACERE